MGLNQITQLRMPDGKEVALVDWSDIPLFSTLEVLQGATQQEMNCFTYTAGDPVPAFAPVPIVGLRTSTELDTNIATSGSMASTEEFLLFSIRPQVFQLRVTDEAAPDFQTPVALDNAGEPLPAAPLIGVLGLRCLVSLFISDKKFANAGFNYFSFGGGPAVGGNGDAGVRAFANTGAPTQEAVRALVIPYHMGGQEKWRLVLENPPGDPLEIGVGDGGNVVQDDQRFARIRFYLDGLLKRPVS